MKRENKGVSAVPGTVAALFVSELYVLKENEEVFPVYLGRVPFFVLFSCFIANYLRRNWI